MNTCLSGVDPDGPWGWFRELARRFLFQTIHDVALMLDRERAEREASPQRGIDTPSVKAAHAKKGFDAGKKILDRKRHIAVDTDGWLLMVRPTIADISDSAGAQAAVFAYCPCVSNGHAPIVEV